MFTMTRVLLSAVFFFFDRSCPVLSVARRGPSGDPNAVLLLLRVRVAARRGPSGGPDAISRKTQSLF